MSDQLDKFQKTRACPKCANSYFTLDVNWMSTYIKTVYTCDTCNWSCIKMANCTSPANVRDPSLSNRLKVSAPQILSE